jgi:DNA topoisomerase-1
MNIANTRIKTVAKKFRPQPIAAKKSSDELVVACHKLPADLHYVVDSQPGIRRSKLRGKFAYFTEKGERIQDKNEIQRINQLAIPPAYTRVWICSDPKGHLQATGRDDRGRKQYRYHARWREVRDANKYERLLKFGCILPKIRKQVEKDLKLAGLGYDKVIATVIALLDSTLIRIGNSQYARENKSFGLTTLRNRHVEIEGNAIHFSFRGKSGVAHEIKLKHPKLSRIIRRCLELPGQHLFQYVDQDDQRHVITSSDVNLYLKKHTDEDFTAKDYRTWAGSALALDRFHQISMQVLAETELKNQLVDIIKEVAKQLGNTPAICRKCYIHPAIIDAFTAGELIFHKLRPRKGLHIEEVALIQFLKNYPK